MSLLASAWIVSRLLAGGTAPPHFLATTGYPDYLAYVLLGLAFNGLAYTALEDGGSAIYDEESEGTWDLLALTPMNRFTWMLAKTLAALTASLLDLTLILVLGTRFVHLTLTLATLPAVLATLVLTLLALQGFAFLMAAVGLTWKQPHALAILLAPLIILMSGMMFPITALPAWAQTLAQLFPLTHALDAIRGALLLQRTLGELRGPLTLLTLTGLAHMAVGYAAFRILERRARRAGAMGRY